ncbi:MAG: alanine racemase [bacterium]|nr:alanine racemase [bacterium]
MNLGLRTFLRFLRRKRFAYEPLITITIDSKAILHNLRAFQTMTKNTVAPVLKSNAYGHGLVQIAEILRSETVPFLCVDSYFEALILRNEEITAPILIIGYTPQKTLESSKLKELSFAIISLDELRRASQQLRRDTKIHLKIDTGMHRHGIMAEEIPEAIKLVRANSRLKLDGVYTHFADADTRDSAHAKKQIENWNAIAAKFRSEFPAVRYFHAAATSGSVYASSLDANVLRLGIGLYGINSGFADLELQPALEMKTRITSLRTIKTGESIGYNATFTATKDIVAATIPAGYYEGIDRRLSGKGALTIKGIPCPILGRVSMNITSIDVTRVPNTSLENEVIVISSEAKAPNSVESMAKTSGTIPYEILVHIPAQIRRIVV